MRHTILRLSFLAATIAASAIGGGWKWGDLLGH